MGSTQEYVQILCSHVNIIEKPPKTIYKKQEAPIVSYDYHKSFYSWDKNCRRSLHDPNS